MDSSAWVKFTAVPPARHIGSDVSQEPTPRLRKRPKHNSTKQSPQDHGWCASGRYPGKTVRWRPSKSSKAGRQGTEAREGAPPVPAEKLPRRGARVSPRAEASKPPPARHSLPCCRCRCRRLARTPRGWSRRTGPRRPSSGRVGGAARRAETAAPWGPARPRPRCRRGTPPGSRKRGCSGHSPCWRRRRRHAGGQPRNGQ